MRELPELRMKDIEQALKIRERKKTTSGSTLLKRQRR